MRREARIQIVLSTISVQQFGVQEWLMNRAMLPPMAASRLQALLTRYTQMQPCFRVLDFPAGAVLVPYELAGIVDDARVLVDRFGREHAEPVKWRFLATNTRK